ncbi:MULTISPECIES: Zn-ribbon domain-containing OB-fold protein [Prauserella salsuginis group]|uniref:Zn-ribbon domain-containing OB-fold protein n=2 Tax=Prauserella salsuginis group TaxID=2893672 RepID=A0A839XXX2_9PSEU|nr:MULTISPECIES: OB-fold domain-containing protein [Prauserella salsuginis group]MBB3664615.1 hypothetical protein [Prauserella sediminis]MCR3722063.1 hypothetical protein [Prauserella flava]MCR3736060.1 hypothetical protein [Prauserella salsuginis]
MNEAVPRPGRLSTPVTAEYWRAAAEGRLLLRTCRTCGHRQLYPRSMCVRCWSEDLGWHEAAGAGTVWAFTVIEVPGHPAWRSMTPYAVVIVELDECPRLLSGLLEQRAYDVRIGQRVRAVTEANGDPTGPIPYFVPAES